MKNKYGNGVCKLLVLSMCLGLAGIVRAGDDAGSVEKKSHSPKKGVAMNAKYFSDFGERLKTLNVSWCYTWGSSVPEGVPESVEFVPIIWGKWNNKPEVYEQLVKEKHQTLLGFNEPDFVKQSDLTVQYVIDAWPRLMETGMRLGSPGCLDATGEWMQEFMKSAGWSDYRVDFITLHNYPSTAAGFLKYVEEVHEMYNLPIWITEFAVFDEHADSPEKVYEFMEEVIPVLESLDYVERYAWTETAIAKNLSNSMLFNKDGTLTKLGKLYASY